MTSAELIQSFKVGVDKTDSLNYANFELDEILLFLNQGQERFVKQRYGLTNTKRQSFEETQKRTDDLRELIKQVTISPNAASSQNSTNGRFFNLPSASGEEYWFAIREEALISYTDCHGDTVTSQVMIKPINHDDYNKFVRDPFNKPGKDLVLRLMYEDKTELLTDGSFSLVNYILRYIKKPIKITSSITSELAEHTHQEIVNAALDVALENIQAQRNQTFGKTLNTEE